QLKQQRDKLRQYQKRIAQQLERERALARQLLRDEVERILEETQEAVEYQRQIDELLAGSFTQEDEDAILEELSTITQEQIELPEVPSEPLPEKMPGISMFDSFEWLELAGEKWILEGNETECSPPFSLGRGPLLPGCLAWGRACLALGLGLGFPGVR
uniref:Charged multivesicular body protein 6 n=1 Tax=Pan troglodytes TaxID=9598 RepID=A0A2I3RVG8_PANTR